MTRVAEVVEVIAFGADPTGRDDSAPAVAAALRHAGSLGRPVRIAFSKGTYQLFPEQAETRELYVSNTVGADQRYRDKRIRLLVEDMHDVTIDGRGAKLVYQMRLIEREEPGAFIWESKNVTMRSINAHYLQTFGIVGQFSEDITIDRVNFAPDSASGRTTASFADFVQMSGIKGEVTITDSVFDGPHDDPINIHGTYLEVAGRPGPQTLALAYKHPQTAGFPQFYPGDEVEFVNKLTMSPIEGGRAVVTAVDGPSGLDHTKPLTTMTVTFDRPIPAEVEIGGTVAENITYTPTVVISGNVFRNVPTRGVLVTTRKPVLIADNRFDAMSMASIYLSSDAYQWYESAHPVHHNITVTQNTFDVASSTPRLSAASTSPTTPSAGWTGPTTRRTPRHYSSSAAVQTSRSPAMTTRTI